MIRNSSDIFCLKEVKLGENDGSQIFSVKGHSSVKINRRQNTSSSVFEFGHVNALKPDDDNQLGSEALTGTEPSVGTVSPEEIIDGNLTNQVCEEDDVIQQGDCSTVVKKGSEEETCSSAALNSRMQRNVLTGDGVEDEEALLHAKSHRRCVKKDDEKWMW